MTVNSCFFYFRVKKIQLIVLLQYIATKTKNVTKQHLVCLFFEQYDKTKLDIQQNCRR